jgi:hypothetical protein
MSKALPALSALTAGLYLGSTQVGYVICLAFQMTATFGAYFSAIGLWLLGALAGLFISSGSRGPALVGLGVAAYYGSSLLLAWAPYDLFLLPVSLLATFMTGLYGGYYFRWVRGLFPSPQPLFFHENNGFLLGYLTAFITLLLYGFSIQQILPAVAAAAHLLVQAQVVNRVGYARAPVKRAASMSAASPAPLGAGGGALGEDS